MALSAFHRADDRPPISQHRAFPAIVALWFAALLGFGSMVVPAALLERGVALTGIAAFVPAASPPLGLTARVLIALVAAVVGAVAGVAIARRVARAHDSDSPLRDDTFANGARRPLDINADLGGEGLASGFGQPVTRRRALAIAEDDRPGDDLYTVPFAGAEVSDPMPAYGERIDTPEVAGAVVEPYHAVEDTVESVADACRAPEPTDRDDEAAMSFAHEFEPLPPASAIDEQAQFEEPEAEPLPFAAPSLTRQTIETEAVALKAERPRPLRPAPTPASDEPELVQLVHRLKSSLERRRGLADAPAAAAPGVPAADFEPAPADDAAQAMAAYFGRPAQAARAVAAPSEEDEEDVDEFDGSYSSLLAMRGPYTPKGNARAPIELLEAETEADAGPVEPEVPVDTDAALRAALAKLQRTSGTA